MNRVDTPENQLLTPLTHVVRYMTDGVPVLNYSEANATNDFPDVSGDHYFSSRRDLILKIRSGEIDLLGDLVLADHRHPLLEGGFTPTARVNSWTEFLGPYRSRLAEEDSGLLEVHPAQPILRDVVEERLLHWETGVLLFRDDEVICFCLPLMIPIAQISALRPIHEGTSLPPMDSECPAKLPTSVAKLLVGMAVNGYGYNPSQVRNEAITDILNDLDLLGLSLDRKTVLKWLSLASALAPPPEEEF